MSTKGLYLYSYKPDLKYKIVVFIAPWEKEHSAFQSSTGEDFSSFS